ncbi:MAG: DMT family transporter [Betaproteobacteria bacterium]
MSSFVMGAVLFAALLHASWNAIVKSGSDTFVDTLLVACGAALVALATLPFLPPPAIESWPYLAASVILEFVYYRLVAAAYRTGDLSYVYPIMRGSAPLLTALVAGFFVAERLTRGGWAGVALISAGILLLAASQWRLRRLHVASTLFALANAVVISTYTLIDALGARLSGNSFSYVGWLTALTGVTLAAFLFWRHREVVTRRLQKRWHVCLAGGLCTWASYAIALWAMTRAPVALVAALRETSVIFGTVLAAVVLKEKFGGARYVAALLVCAGAVFLKVF